MKDNVIRYEEDDFDISSNDLDSEIGDFDLENAIYEVWALGYENGRISDIEVLLGSFDNPQKAGEFAYTVNKDLISAKVNDTDNLSNIDTFEIEVETTVNTEDGCSNVGTIFRTELVV